MSSLHHLLRAFLFLFFTFIIWLGDAVVAVTIARSMGLILTIPQALLLGVALGLSSAIPSTPGYIGIYQFVAVTVLPPFGISNSQALGFIVVMQALSYLITTIFGGIGLWQLDLFNLKETIKEEVGKDKEITNDG